MTWAAMLVSINVYVGLMNVEKMPESGKGGNRLDRTEFPASRFGNMWPHVHPYPPHQTEEAAREALAKGKNRWTCKSDVDRLEPVDMGGHVSEKLCGRQRDTSPTHDLARRHGKRRSAASSRHYPRLAAEKVCSIVSVVGAVGIRQTVRSFRQGNEASAGRKSRGLPGNCHRSEKPRHRRTCQMNLIKPYLGTIVVCLIVTALVFRVGAVKKIIVG
jgi:hypothetical protein